MLCLDWEHAEIDLYGTESSGIYSELDVMIMPCNVKLSPFGATDERIAPDCVNDLDEQIKYLGPMNMLVYFNQESFMQDEYGNARIGRFSTIRNIQTDEYRPNFIIGTVQKNSLQDESQVLQLGEEEEFLFNSVHFSNPRPSAWSGFPTDASPDTRYKFSSIAFTFGPDLNVIERSTYSILEWLGDVGGLFDALRILGAFIVLPVASMSMKQALLSTLFS